MKTAPKYLIAAAALTFAACGGDGGPPAGPDAEDNAACQATASYGAATATDQQGFQMGAAAPTQLSLLGALNADSPPDLIDIELFKGFGAFTTGEIRTGTFEITGEELTFATCGVCVFIGADYVDGVGPTSDYLATGGTVTITSVSPNLTGTMSNMTFEHVTVDAGASTPHVDGCESALTSLSFDALLTVE